MKNNLKLFYIFFITLFLISPLSAADKTVSLSQGWNQIRVPLDSIKMSILKDTPNVSVIWAFQNGRYNLATNDLNYKLLGQQDSSVGEIRALTYGESLYIFADEETSMTFVGQEKLNPPVRSDKMSNAWTLMSRADFASSDWDVISKIVGDTPIIASKIVMKNGVASIKVFSNVAEEVAKINPEYFEDFQVSDDEAFWIKDASNVDDINKFDFSIKGTTPNNGGELAKFNLDISSNNKSRHYLGVKLVAFKDGNFANKEHELFNDYVNINQGVQEVKAIVPMVNVEEYGTYRVYAIKDLNAQYEKRGIDIYDLAKVSQTALQEAYQDILANSSFVDISISGVQTEVVYDMEVSSREYANDVLYYNPLKELNRLAKNQSKDLSELSYTNIGRHTEFSLNLNAYGNVGRDVDTTKIKAFIEVGGAQEPVIVLGEGGDLKETYDIKNVKISLPQKKQVSDIALSVMLYDPKSLQDNQNLDLYNKVLADLQTVTTQKATYSYETDKEIEENKICLDKSCSQWMFKKDFTLSFAVSDTEPTENDIVATSTITLYSETFSSKNINSYESKDTSSSLTRLLLREDVYSDEISKRRAGALGDNTTLNGSDVLINDLTALESDLESSKDAKLIFDPLQTYENDLINQLMFTKDELGGLSEEVSDTALHDAWVTYVNAAGAENLCDRKNYFGLTVPYTKKVKDSLNKDVEVLTATEDLCLYNVKYSHLSILKKTVIEGIAEKFKTFVLIKNSRNEEDRLADFWNPLFSFDNSTLHMPDGYFKTLPYLNKRIGGGASFSSKLALDSELNEIRAATYADVDVALVAEFKLFDLDFETVLSASDTEASRFDFFMYSINPIAKGEQFKLKKIVSFHQPIPTKYATSEKADITVSKKLELNFTAGPIPVRFEFEIGLYSYFMVGVDLDISNKFMIYAVPGSRIYGTISGGVGINMDIINVMVGLEVVDFTVVRAAVPIVAQLDNFRLDRDGFSTDFKLFSSIELKVAEVLLRLTVDVSTGKAPLTIPIAKIDEVIWDYKGIDPLSAIGHVGTGLESDITPCQSHYYGWELFCVKKTLEIKFKFSGLTNAECSLLDTEYLRRSEIDGDTSYLFSTNEYRKVRGCINDKYEFANVNIDDWQLSLEQWDDINNVTFWKWDSRATISKQLEEEGISITPTISEIISESLFGEEPEDAVNDAWKELTGVVN